MKETKPKFLLTRVYEDGTQETPQVAPLIKAINESKMNRRGFIGAGLTASAAVAWLSGCDPESGGKHVIPSISCYGTYAHKDSVLALVISPDGKTLISAGESELCKAWALPDGALIQDKTYDSAYALAFSPDGKWLFTTSWGVIYKWNFLSDKLIDYSRLNIEGDYSDIVSLAITPDGRYLLSSSKSVIGTKGCICLWDMSDDTLLKTFHKIRVKALAVAPDGRHFFSGDDDGNINYWSLPDCELLATWKKSNTPISSLAVSPDGKWLVAGDKNDITLFSIPDGAEVSTTEAHSDEILTFAFTPDGRHVFSGSRDKTFKQWSIPDFALKKTVKQDGAVNELAITPDGRFLFSGTSDRRIKLWILPEVMYVYCMIDLKYSETSVEGVKYSITNERGQTITYVLPCGSTIPKGAFCTCNCVSGEVRPPCGCDGHVPCTCLSNTCACNLVCICLAT